MKYNSLCNNLSRFFKPAGFTLIELLLVIAVVSILIVTVSVALNPFEQLRKANDGRRKSDLAELQKALELFYQDNGSYPTATDGNITWGATGSSPYIRSTPTDPRSGQRYLYTNLLSGNGYAIYAGLERGSKDPQACTAPGKSCNFNANGVTASSCGPISCNYGVSSPNVIP